MGVATLYVYPFVLLHRPKKVGPLCKIYSRPTGRHRPTIVSRNLLDFVGLDLDLLFFEGLKGLKARTQINKQIN